MTELSPETAGQWLAAHGFPSDSGSFSELGGGVSNTVILAQFPSRRAILKQSLAKLRVESDWQSDRERIFREAAAMQWLDGRIRGGRIPRILFEDRASFAFAMEAAPAGARNWKSLLLAGEFDKASAAAAGAMLGSMIHASWNHTEARALFGDQTVFDQLRIDPYYRFTARRYPELAPHFAALIERSSARRVSLVHGDWSPKNFLVTKSELWAIDWEVIHFGDPSFDVAFLLNHLLLKSIRTPAHREPLEELAICFSQALAGEIPPDGYWIGPAALEHLPALLLARVGGKSPAEYLDARAREHAERIAHGMFLHPVHSVAEAFARTHED